MTAPQSASPLSTVTGSGVGTGEAVTPGPVQDRGSCAAMTTRVRLTSEAQGVRTWCVTTTIVCEAARHDTISAYKNAGCRCPGAARRVGKYERRREAGHVAPNQPAELTVRRLQALAVIGWPADEIAQRIGRHAVSVSQIRRSAHGVVTGATATAVLKVYRRLCDTAGPSERTRAYARRQGWSGPSADLMHDGIDEVAVQRACSGEQVRLSRGERLTAVRVLHQRGYTYREVAGRLHISERQVHRDLSDLGCIAGVA